MTALRHVIRKELLQLRRDRKMIPVLLAAPIIQLLAFGYAANLDVVRVPLWLADHDRSAESRALQESFTGSGYFELQGVGDSGAEITRALVSGGSQVALVIPEGFGADLRSGRRAALQVIADGSDATSAVQGLSYASRIIAGRSAEETADRVAAMRRRAGAEGAIDSPSLGKVELISRVWFNPNLRSRWFYIPAILAMVLMLTTMVLPSMAVVREKEIGTLEQIIVTPIRSWELIVGKLFPFGVIGLLTTCLVTLLAVTLFAVPLRGSFFLLLGLTALFLLTTLGLGLFVSTLVRNQQQAMMSSIYLLMVPMIYLSGLLFPIENMPRPIQAATCLIPLRYYNEILRGIFLKGSGVAELWPNALILAVYGVAIVGLAAARFRKRLD